MTTLDDFSRTTIPIEQCFNGKPYGHATSFIWRHGEQLYLITNWHVVSGKNFQSGANLSNGRRPDMLRAYLNLRTQKFGKQVFDITIRDPDDRPLWFVHNSYGSKVDIVAIPLPVGDDSPISSMRPINNLTVQDLPVHVGMEVFILGYPFGVDPPGYPVWKRGSIASEPDLAPLTTNYMLVDTASRPGMSGSPVIRRRTLSFAPMGGAVIPLDRPSATKLVGIYSGRLHTKDRSDAQIGIVWPTQLIEEIVAVPRPDE